jgi:predicted enzyme related to lactoylglutathione lyase
MIQLLVNVDVDDVERATEFYVQALGLEVGRRFGAAGVELVGGSSPVHLLAKAAGSTPFGGTQGGRHYRRHWTPVHLDVVVDDVDAAVRRAVGAGAALEGEIATHAWGRIAVLADPFGHGFCLLQLLGRGYDEIAQR